MRVRSFIDDHFLHFNSRELVRAAHAWEQHIHRGGKVLLSMAGAMSTARIGKILARALDEGLVHAISCTGANLEEDAFSQLAGSRYEAIDDWRALRAEDEAALLARGMNRVTDTCIPETVMRDIEQELIDRWSACCDTGERALPAQHLLAVLNEPAIAARLERPSESWLLAASRNRVPIFTPGWEDSTTGNMFAAAVWRGEVAHHSCVAAGTEQMVELMSWYLDAAREGSDPGVGFFQIGGGIAGDFAICAVPTLAQDLGMTSLPRWAWFAQVSDAVTSYGGYSGAVPNEKITWGKLDVASPKFMIESDATIVVPLILAWLLGD